MTSKVTSPWDSIAWDIINDHYTDGKEYTHAAIVKALSNAYTKGRDAGERMEREYPRSKSDMGY